jgi:RNA polymerase sigma factor (sigma-70 family)
MPSPVRRSLYIVDGTRAEPAAGLAGPLTPDAAFRAYAGFVASVALRVLGRPSEVDDLVQDVFLRVMRRLGDLRDPAALRGWLAVITARLARRRLRTRSWKLWLGVDGDYDYAQLADRSASPDARALIAELYHARIARRQVEVVAERGEISARWGRERRVIAAGETRLELAPDGPLAEDALAREVEAWSRCGEVEIARARATTYSQRYPRGRRAQMVRRFGGLEQP